MRKSRKRKVVKPQLPEPKAPKTAPVASKQPAKTAPVALSSPSTTKSGKKSIGSKTAPKKSSEPSSATTKVTDQRRSSVDDFAMDIESQMMDILEDDDDDDDDEGNQSTATAPPVAPTDTAVSSDTDTFEEVVVHPTQSQRPSTDSPTAMNRKRKYKMASQPIRRLDNVSSPATAAQPATPPVSQPPQPRREFGGKSISSAAALAANRNRKMAQQQQQQSQHNQSSDSSSGSSSSEDESGSSSSDGSGSSSSESEDDGSSDSDSSSDDDMDGLVADISRSLSADTHSVPPSPAAARSHNTPVVPERSPYSASPATRGTPKNGGPMSLRALYSKFSFFYHNYEMSCARHKIFLD